MNIYLIKRQQKRKSRARLLYLRTDPARFQYLACADPEKIIRGRCGWVGVQGSKVYLCLPGEMCPNHSWQFYNWNLLSLSFPGEGGYFPYKINKMYTCISGLTTDCLITYASASDMYILRLKAAEVFTIQVLLK